MKTRTLAIRPFRTKRPVKSSATKGFALVVTLSPIILYTVIAVGLLTLSSISLRAYNSGQATARANASMSHAAACPIRHGQG